MSLRLHALGFPADWNLATAELRERVADARTREVAASRGHYRLWRSPQGAELWFHRPDPVVVDLDALRRPPEARRRVNAVTPLHNGLSRCVLRVGRILTLDRANPLEGSCLAWLPPAAEGGREQVIVLELAPFALHKLPKPPFRTTGQVLCAAHAVWAYPGAAAYSAATPASRRIPAGSYRPVTEQDLPEVKFTYGMSPVTLGLATGIVRRSIRHVNPVTREPYYWLLLETRRGTFDVVASPDAVAGDISEGHVAQVCGSFLARLEGVTF